MVRIFMGVKDRYLCLVYTKIRNEDARTIRVNNSKVKQEKLTIELVTRNEVKYFSTSS